MNVVTCRLLSFLHQGYLRKWVMAKDTCRPVVASHASSGPPVCIMLQSSATGPCNRGDRQWMIAAPRLHPPLQPRYCPSRAWISSRRNIQIEWRLCTRVHASTCSYVATTNLRFGQGFFPFLLFLR